MRVIRTLRCCSFGVKQRKYLFPQLTAGDRTEEPRGLLEIEDSQFLGPCPIWKVVLEL